MNVQITTRDFYYLLEDRKRELENMRNKWEYSQEKEDEIQKHLKTLQPLLDAFEEEA